jgi:hypothetical protein
MSALHIMYAASVVLSGLFMVVIAVLIATHDPDGIAQAIRDRKVRERERDL